MARPAVPKSAGEFVDSHRTEKTVAVCKAGHFWRMVLTSTSFRRRSDNKHMRVDYQADVPNCPECGGGWSQHRPRQALDDVPGRLGLGDAPCQTSVATDTRTVFRSRMRSAHHAHAARATDATVPRVRSAGHLRTCSVVACPCAKPATRFEHVWDGTSHTYMLSCFPRCHPGRSPSGSGYSFGFHLSKEERKMETSPAQIAWSQISVMTKMACGAREASTSDEGKTLTFKVAKRQTWIRVQYDEGADLYGVQLIKGASCAIKENLHGVGAEELSETIYGLVNR